MLEQRGDFYSDKAYGLRLIMSDKLQSIIARVIAGSSDEADLQAIAAALQAGQIVLAMGERSVAIGGDVSNSMMVTGDNNQVIVLAEAAAIALEWILQQWQPKQDRYVQPKGCQNRQACDRYLVGVLQRLERLGSPEIRQDVVHNGKRFNYIAKLVDFEPGLGMRGEAAKNLSSNFSVSRCLTKPRLFRV